MTEAPPVPPSTLPTTALRVVLVSPKEPGNIGSSARAMLNMGVSDLRIVAPRCDVLAPEALYMSVHARALVENAQICSTLEQATQDCDFVVGTSAREYSDLIPARYPGELRTQIWAARNVAVVFGREESGLTTEELARCQARVRIPTAEYSSLNLAQAVLIVLYEFIQSQRTTPTPLPRKENLAPREQLEGSYAQLKSLILEIGYTDPRRVDHMMRLYRKIFDRAQLEADEVRMFRGLWAQMSWIAKGNKPNLGGDKG
ncbi:MAG: RNA methyltransferase [Pseudopedobacter sp.]|nr:RNA methyltransferase [Deinococcales bacterium]